MMIRTPGYGITRDQIVPAINSAGALAAALTSPANAELELWNKAIDQLLAWRKMAEADASEDLPIREVTDSAIDFAYDQFARDQIDGEPTCAPDSMVPSGAGRIAMEWNNENGTVILEFVEPGTATYTSFDRNGKLLVKHFVKRDPVSRKLELKG